MAGFISSIKQKIKNTYNSVVSSISKVSVKAGNFIRDYITPSEAKNVVNAAAQRKGIDMDALQNLYNIPNETGNTSILQQWEQQAPSYYGSASKGVRKYLTRAVVVREGPSVFHTKKHGGAPIPITTEVYFLTSAEGLAEHGFDHIRYIYNSKEEYGWILGGNLADTPAGGSRAGTISTVTTPSRAGTPVSVATGGGTKSVSNALGSNYVVFSPEPDVNAENELLSSRGQYEEPFNIFVLPGYTPARMTIYTYIDGKQVARSFEFLVGPSNMNESNTNSVVPIKTGSGYFLLRAGAELGRLAISGYLLESREVDERRLFMENYYRSYLIDKVNTFHSYFNESSLYLELEGYRYQCILQNLDLNKTSNSMFVFRYTMNLLVLNQEPIGNIRRPSGVSGKRGQQATVPEIVRGVAYVLGKAVSLTKW